MNAQFTQFLLPESLLRGLEKVDYTTPTPVQAQVVPLAMDGLDLLVCAATGSGKTAAFMLPIMQRCIDRRETRGSVRALVLVPTRELARQVYIHGMRLASYTRLTAAVITGGERYDYQIAALRKNPDILVATPGRLLEFIKRGEADLSGLEILVLDEADRMLDMGFGADVLAIVEHSNPARQSMLFSATLHHRGLSEITERFLHDPVVVGVDPIREQHPDIAHQAVLSDDRPQKELQCLWLLRNEPFEKALVFVNTRERATSLGNLLIGHGVRTGILHGELDQRERNRIMGLFLGGRIGVLVATDLAARGLDVPGVQLVINFELPRRGDDYLHRTGRTGRAGAKGVAIAMVSPPDWNRMEGIERYLKLDLERRGIPGIKTRFDGTVKRKGGHKPGARVAKPVAATPAPRVKERVRDRKNIGKRRKPTAEGAVDSGFTPLRRQGE